MLCALLVLAAAPNVVDSYNALAKLNRVSAMKDPEQKDLEDPIVDVKNGYLKHRYSVGACDEETTTAALFLAKGHAYLAVALQNVCIESSNSSIAFYEGTQNVLDKSGALKTVTFADFFDKPPKDLDEVTDAMRLLYELPREGTTVKVTLVADADPPTGVETAHGPRAVKLAAKATYATIELKWDAAKGVFTMGTRSKR